MIMDGKNTFSALDTGDVITVVGATVGDNPSTYAIDGGVSGVSYSTVANGGAYVNPFLVVRVHTAFTTTTSTGTLQIVLQESVDNSTYTDLMASPVFNVNNGDLPAYALLLAVRMPQIKKRYIRVVYRIAGESLTAGSLQAFLTLDAPQVDLFLRENTGYVTAPTGVMDHSQPASTSGILDS